MTGNGRPLFQMPEFIIDTPSLLAEWVDAPWDSLTDVPALQITKIHIRGPSAAADMRLFERERDRISAALVTCRLPHDDLRESMLLEEKDFRFVEMLYRPELDLVRRDSAGTEPRLSVAFARGDDLPSLEAIAGVAFRNERFHMDHRLGPELGDRRYKRWVRNSLEHPTQRMYVLRDSETIIAFFVIEMLADMTCYWHLNAVSPNAQGRGYGRRAWQTMIDHALEAGARRVRTSVVARNYRVINLYASLGFRFSPPLMTFHWVKEGHK